MIVWTDSFDHYGVGPTGAANMLLGAYAENGFNSSTQGPNNTVARTGDYSMYCTNQNGVLRKTYGGLKMVAGAGVAVYMPSLPNDTGSRIRFVFRSQANADLLTVTVNTDGTVSCYIGSYTGTLVGTSISALTASGWHHLEVKAVISETLGSIEVRLNGETIFVATDLNTGTAEISQFAFLVRSSSFASATNTYIDDLVLWDDQGGINDDFIGPVRVYTVFPDGDISPSDWTPVGAATNSAAIDESAPDGDTSYTQGDTEGDTFQVTLPTLPGDIGLINAVQVVNMSRVSEAGAAQIQVSVESGAESEQGSLHTLTTAYTYRGDVFQVNPDGDIPWTRATLEAAIIQVEKTV